MPIGTPFHPRTEPLCASRNWRVWSGYFVASSYDVMHDYEYHAIRNTAALIDISPLFKYDVTGKDALRLVNRVITRDAAKCAVGQALYGCICDNEGKVIQDGTVFRLAENRFRFNLAEPSVRWLSLNAKGMDVDITEVSEQFAALALQGPNAYKILQPALNVDIGKLRFFRWTKGKIQDAEVIVSRTGYTGDLGYEIWLSAEFAPRLWDALLEAGKPFGIKPAGLLALDVARLEAGFILLEVDYIGTDRAMSPGQKYSPYEIGLGWTVDLNKEHFVGRKALLEEKAQGSPRQIVGLEIDLPAYESLYHDVSLPPQFPAAAWRGVVPLYRNGLQVGHATTGAWSPALKKYIALATVRQDCTRPGSTLNMEVLIEYSRRTTPVNVVPLPFYDPPRKRALFGQG